MLTPVDAIAALWMVWGTALTPTPGPPLPETTAAAITVSADACAPLVTLTDQELLARLSNDPRALGPLSIGAPGGGLLFNAVAMPPGPRWDIASNSQPWGTAETIASLRSAIDTVHDLFPGTAPVRIGDISDPDGGKLKRHETHQSGRDADVGFYFKDGSRSTFVNGTATNLDLPRNWALVRALVVQTDVETILLDNRIQKLLYQYALTIGEDKAWLDRVFRFSKGSPESIVRHVKNHRNHYHVRFYSPVAQELGRRAHPLLVQLKLASPPVYAVRHVARPGQTLGHLADRYGTSVRAIMAANGLHTTQIRAGRSYRIPVRAAAPAPLPVTVPLRLLPPHTPPEMAAVPWPTPQTLYGINEDR